MTVEKAIKKIEYRIAIDGFDGKDSEDLKMAIRALEEQQSKKKNNKVIYSHDLYAYCPHCGRNMTSTFMKPSVCMRCGGELEWR